MKSITSKAVFMSMFCLALVAFAAASPLHAQTIAATSTGTTTLPNTGLGGEVVRNVSLMLLAGIIALGGIVYMARRFA